MREILFGFGAAIALIAALGAPAQADYQPKGKRDPFVPLLTAEGQRIRPPGSDEELVSGISGLSLQGIVFDPQTESYAIINGKVVRRGDEIEGMTITDIAPLTVTIAAHGQTHQLSVQTTPPTEETTPDS